MLCPVYGHELTPLSCPPSQGVSFRSFKGLIILSPYMRSYAPLTQVSFLTAIGKITITSGKVLAGAGKRNPEIRIRTPASRVAVSLLFYTPIDLLV